VLRAFRPGDGFLGNQEIAQRTDLPKATISRLTYTLTNLGYLSYSERLEKYQLGVGVLALGFAFLSNLAIRQLARPLMQELANDTGAGVGLAERHRRDMIYVEYCAPRDVMTFRQEVGDRMPMATTSLGRAYLCALPKGERDHLLDLLEDREPDRWEQVEAGVRKALGDFEQRGFCSSMGEWNSDVNAIAAPLVVNERSIYAFNCGGPAYRLSVDYLEREVAPLLKNMVQNVEASMIRF